MLHLCCFALITAALAEDHLNDVISNAAAMVTAAIAFHTPYWWMDPIGMYIVLWMLLCCTFGVV